METGTIFRIILPFVLVLFMVHRGYYVKYHSKPEEQTLKQREEGTESRVAGLLGFLGFVSLLVFVINPLWLDWAALPFPAWLRWLGVFIALAGFALLQWSQTTLGKSWSDTPRMMKEQALITGGPYHFIRHPIYTAFLLILGSTLLISANWLIGLTWIGMTTLEVTSRIRFEEALMVEYFDGKYIQYMERTGRLFPKIFSRKSLTLVK